MDRIIPKLHWAHVHDYRCVTVVDREPVSPLGTFLSKEMGEGCAYGVTFRHTLKPDGLLEWQARHAFDGVSEKIM